MNLHSENNEAYRSSEFQENLEILRQIYFFSGFPLEALKVIAYICTRVTFKQGEYLFRQDDDDGQAFYIISGTANLVYRNEEGGEQMIRDYNTGDFLGGIALMDTMHRLFSLKAVTGVTCLILPREKFLKAMEQFPDLVPKTIRSIIEGICAWEKGFLIDHAVGCDACRRQAGVSLV